MKSTIRKISIIGMIAIAVIAFGTRQNIVASFSEPIDINVDLPESYDDVKAVKTDLDLVIGLFAEEETTTKNKYGSVTNKSYNYYYVIPVYTEEYEEYYVAVKVSSKQKSAYDKVCDTTWACMYGEADELDSVEFEGALLEITDDELYDYYMEFFEGDEEAMEYALPYILTPVNLQATKIITIVGAVLFVVLLVMLILTFRKGKEKKNGATPTKLVMTINGMNYPVKDFERVNSLVVSGDKEGAVREVMWLTGVSETEANDIIMNWNTYWN